MNAGNVDESEHEMHRCTHFLERFEVYQKMIFEIHIAPRVLYACKV